MSEHDEGRDPAAPVPDGTPVDRPEAGPDAPAEPVRLVVRRRRAPRYKAFAISGALVGALIGLAVALSRPVGDEFSMTTVAGYFAVVLGLIGALAGLAVALIAERRH